MGEEEHTWKGGTAVMLALSWGQRAALTVTVSLNSCEKSVCALPEHLGLPVLHSAWVSWLRGRLGQSLALG